MVEEDRYGGSVNDVVTAGDVDRDEVATQLQQVYEYVLNNRRPEAVGATERLARQLDIDIERPPRFSERTRC